MIDGNPPPEQWIEMAWAARDAAHPALKAEQRGWFEGVKCLLGEPDLRPTITHPPAGILAFVRRVQG